MATFDEFYASLDADKNIRGDQFEKKFALWFLKTDPKWSSQIEGVWGWDEYPKRSEWGTDCGVDIILHHTNGERWAVQAKCFSPDNYLNKDELNSFIAESSDERFQGKLLISSTNKIGPNADRLLKRHKVVRILLKDLRDADINYPSSIKNLYRGSPVKKYDPKPHQKEAINDVLEKLKKVNKGQVIMACGTGKSLTSLWINEKLNANHTLVLVPSLGLLRQILKTWTTHKNHIFKWLCVCSDSTVSKKKKNQDEWIANTSELDISVTSDVLKIKDFLSQSGKKVIFSTYQSSKLIAEVQITLNDFYFDLTIADEAHNCAGRVASYFGHVLNDSKIRSRKKLFFTATPRILSKRIKNNALKKEIEVASMDEKSKFGEVLHKLNFSKAIKDDLLTDYQVAIIGVDNKEIQQKIIQRELISSSGDYIFDAESLGTYIAMLKAIKNYKLTKLISFHNLIKHAETFSINFPFVSNLFKDYFDNEFNIDSDYVKGAMNTTDKEEKLEKLKTANQKDCFILSNSRCLSEGVDVPALDGIAFIDPKHSPTDIVQAVGRAIRKSDNKTKGTIVIPVFLGEVDNLDEQILSTKFSTVWNVILALKSQDDELLETIDDLRIQLGSRKITKITSKGLKKIYFDLPENINPKFYESLYTILVENTSDDWLVRFGELKEFKKEHGHTKPNTRKSNLGRWCGIQRTLYTKKKLLRERVDLLDNINFDWDPAETKWQNMFSQLKEFKKKYGHATPKRDNDLLGVWCQTQRKTRKEKKLSQKRIDLLDNINFDWDPFESQWQNKFSQLEEFKKEYGHTSPPGHNKDFSQLSMWCSVQRMYHDNNNLSKERFDLLDSINFDWDPIETEWQNNFSQLKEFKKEHGHTNPNAQDNLFGHWCSRQRGFYKKGKLSKEKVDLLDSINFDWDPIETKWQNMFSQLKEFKKEHGHASPSGANKEFSLLGKWCERQRSSRKKKILSQEKIDLLDSINFDWDLYETEWQNKFSQLKEFKKEHGHTSPSSTNKEFSLLGKWCEKQRSFHNQGKLSQQRFDLLDNLNFDWDPIETEWQNRFSQLKEFKKEHGHASPSSTNKEFSLLGKWCLTQRSRHNQGKLSQERYDLLDSLKFDWDPVETKWQNMFSQLKEFKKEHGHTSPSKHVRQFKSLGIWCIAQRQINKKGKLLSERFDLLDTIGFRWD